MKIGYILFTLVVLAVFAGCIHSSKTQASGVAENKKKIIEAKSIQKSFEDAYSELKVAIDEGNQKAAQKSYKSLLEAYNLAKEKAGKTHMKFMVNENNLSLLNNQINRGDFKDANKTISGIAGSCGVTVCHQRTGGSMVNLEYEYGVIQKAVQAGDLATARKHFPAFKKYFYESKKLTSKFLPELTKERMKDEYVDNLEAALKANNTEAAQKAVNVISKNTCSLAGCHAIFLS